MFLTPTETQMIFVFVSLFRMCEGEKRKLVIPSDMGYGDKGAPPKIPGQGGLPFFSYPIYLLSLIKYFIPSLFIANSPISCKIYVVKIAFYFYQQSYLSTVRDTFCTHVGQYGDILLFSARNA